MQPARPSPALSLLPLFLASLAVGVFFGVLQHEAAQPPREVEAALTRRLATGSGRASAGDAGAAPGTTLSVLAAAAIAAAPGGVGLSVTVVDDLTLPALTPWLAAAERVGLSHALVVATTPAAEAGCKAALVTRPGLRGGQPGGTVCTRYVSPAGPPDPRSSTPALIRELALLEVASALIGSGGYTVMSLGLDVYLLDNPWCYWSFEGDIEITGTSFDRMVSMWSGPFVDWPLFDPWQVFVSPSNLHLFLGRPTPAGGDLAGGRNVAGALAAVARRLREAASAAGPAFVGAPSQSVTATATATGTATQTSTTSLTASGTAAPTATASETAAKTPAATPSASGTAAAAVGRRAEDTWVKPQYSTSPPPPTPLPSPIGSLDAYKAFTAELFAPFSELADAGALPGGFHLDVRIRHPRLFATWMELGGPRTPEFYFGDVPRADLPCPATVWFGLGMEQSSAEQLAGMGTSAAAFVPRCWKTAPAQGAVSLPGDITAACKPLAWSIYG